MAHKRSYNMQAAPSSETDDLTLIKGIGPTTAACLRNTGILTFAQLADLTPEEIAKRVIGLSAKRIASEDWIKQAQKLDPKAAYHQAPSSEAASEFRQHYATFTVELLLEEDNSVRRTRVANVQNKVEDTWASWEEPKLIDFITKYAGIHAPYPEPTSQPKSMLPNKASLLPETVIALAPTPEIQNRERPPHSKIKDGLSGVLRVIELLTLPLDSNVPQHIAQANEPFNVHMLLDLTEVKASPSVPLNCTVTVWAKKLGTGARQIIGEQQSTSMPVDKIPCLVESMIPSKGTYRLEALVTLTPASTVPSSSSTLKAWLEEACSISISLCCSTDSRGQFL